MTGRAAEDTAPPPQPPQARLRPLAMHLGLFILYLAVRWWALGGIAPLHAADTELYAAQYREGFDKGLFGQARPWAYPLLLRICGYHWELIVALQRLASSAAWYGLGLAAMAAFRFAFLRWFALAATLLLSFTLHVVAWDPQLLTESLTVTLFVAVSAAWLRALGDPRRAAAWMAAVTLLAIPFSGLRDGNALLTLLLAALALAVFAGRSVRALRGGTRPERAQALAGAALAALLLGVGLFHYHDTHASKRGWANVANVINIRALVKLDVAGQPSLDVANADWLAQHFQMPERDALMHAGRRIGNGPPPTEAYRAWLENTGPRAWSSFLLHHPGWLIANFKKKAQYGVPETPYVDVLRKDWSPARIKLPAAVHRLLHDGLRPLFTWPPLNTALLVCAALTGLLWAVAAWRNGPLRPSAPMLGLLCWLYAISFLAPLIAFVGDAIETWRHSLVGLVAFYLTLPLAPAALAQMLADLGGAWLKRKAGAQSERAAEAPTTRPRAQEAGKSPTPSTGAKAGGKKGKRGAKR